MLRLEEEENGVAFVPNTIDDSNGTNRQEETGTGTGWSPAFTGELIVNPAKGGNNETESIPMVRTGKNHSWCLIALKDGMFNGL